MAQTYPIFGIKVEMWYTNIEDPFDEEYCGEFLWGLFFQSGATIIFDTAKDALEFMYANKRGSSIPGFEYRYRICQLDNSDLVFEGA